MADENEIIINTKISADGLVAGTKELEEACKRAASSVDGIGKKAQASVQKSVAAITKQNQAYNAQAEKVRAIKEELSTMAGNKEHTEEWEYLSKEASKTAMAISKLKEKQQRFLATGGKEDSTTYKRMAYDIQNAQAELAHLYETTRELRADGKEFQAVDTSALQSKLSAEESKLAGMRTGLEQAVGGLEQKLTDYSQAGETAAGVTGRLRAAFSAVASVAKTLGKTLVSIAKKGLHAVATGAKKAASGFAGLVKKMAGFGGDSGKSSLGRSITTMLKYGLGIRSLYALTNKLRSALTDGMSNLKSYSTSANQSITAMENSVTRLKNSVAAAFSPILSIVAPIVTKLINLLATAISYIGAFFAALSGQRTYTKAVAATEGVAGALDDAAGSAGGAADAMDDYLSGLDEIHKFDDGSASGGGGGGGGAGGGSTGVMFEEAEIPGLVTDWADKFKEAWEKADFTEIGTVVGTKLKNALDNIPWDELQAKCNKIATSVATFINGFVATPGLWDTVGSTIGNGINTAVGMYNKFMDTTNFVNIGNAIATSLNKTLKTTDWTSVGKALTQKLRAAIETLYGFVINFDFGELGNSIARFINGAINNIPAGKFGTAIGTLVNGIATVIVRVFGGVDKQSLVTKIKDFFQNAFNAVDPNLVKQAITTVVNALIDLISLAFGTGESTGVVNKLVDFLTDVFGSINTSRLLLAIDSLTNTLTDVIYQAVSSIDLLYILAVLFDTFNAILAGLLSQIPIIGESIAEHLQFDYSADYLKSKGVTLGESAADGVNDGFSGTLGGKLPVTAANAVDKAKAEIDNRDGRFTAAGTAAADGVVGGLGTAAVGAGTAGASAKSAFTDPWATTEEEFRTTSTEITGALDNLPGDLGGMSAETYDGMISEFDDAKSDYKKISKNISTSFKTLPTELQATFKKAYTSAKKEWSTAKTDFSQTSASIISSFSNLASGLKIKFASAFTAAKEAWKSAKSSFSTTSADIISSFSNLASGVKIKFNSAFTEAKNAWSGAKSAFVSIANNIVSAFSGVVSGVKSHFATACNGITVLGWYSAGAAAAKSVVNGLYEYSPSSWCSWFVGKIYFSGTYNIGYNLTAGIIRGMYSTSGLGSWASWFVSRVKASLGIHSPSTVMRDEVGAYLGEGIGVGLEKSTGGILKIVSGLADKIVDGFQNGVSGIVLDSPALAGGAFGGISYKYPVLASGTVLPPQVVYSTQKADTSDIVDQLKTLVAELTRGGRSGNGSTTGNVIHNVVQINRRTLYEEMKKEEELAISQSGRS